MEDSSSEMNNIDMMESGWLYTLVPKIFEMKFYYWF